MSLLFSKGFEFQSLLHYAPFSSRLIEPSINPVKKIKVEEKKDENAFRPFGICINDRQYITS